MKHIKIIQLVGVLLLFSCINQAGQVMVTNDEFKNVTLMTLEQKVYSEEGRGAFNPPYDLQITYTRQLKPPADAQIEARVRIGGFAPDEGILKREAILKIDQDNVPVQLKEISGGIDQVYTYTATKTGFTNTAVTKSGRAVFIISDELQQKLLDGKEWALRVYAESKSLTFVYGKDEIVKLKEFLTANNPKNDKYIEK